MTEPHEYGSYYYSIMTPTGPMHLYANTFEVTPAGALIAHGDNRKSAPLLVLAAGQWLRVDAISVLDGHPVAVDYDNTLKLNP